MVIKEDSDSWCVGEGEEKKRGVDGVVAMRQEAEVTR